MWCCRPPPPWSGTGLSPTPNAGCSGSTPVVSPPAKPNRTGGSPARWRSAWGRKGFDFASAAEILREINRLTPSYAGITPERLQTQGLQWPCPDAQHPGTPILHQERFTRGKGNFVPIAYQGPAEVPDAGLPVGFDHRAQPVTTTTPGP